MALKRNAGPMRIVEETRDLQHNNSYKSNIHNGLLEHNKNRHYPQPGTIDQKPTPLTVQDLRLARARLYVRGLLSEAENARVAARIEKFTEIPQPKGRNRQ
jgi:hypothetical protein